VHATLPFALLAAFVVCLYPAASARRIPALPPASSALYCAVASLREEPFMITRIAHLCLAATDLAATERFYITGLGFRKLFDFLRGGQVIGFYLEVCPGNYVEVFRRDHVDPEAKAPISHLCLETADIDAVSRQLKSLGYTVTDKKLGADQSWQTWVTDPAGVRIEFHQYTPNSSQTTHRNCVLD
jgi:catechol 2,3-dioxygenase-like lactoylglutathione lyase family enzyme